MFPRPSFIPRATLLIALAAVVAFFSSEPAGAIQLRWSTGTTDLTVEQNQQAVLVVQADSAEVTLPDTWRLQWTADSSGINFLPFDSTTACLVDTARVSSIEPPLTAADSASNQITAHFCSGGAGSASIGYWIMNLAGGSQGKLKVVALDPADPDSNTVLESNEVTFNGGIDGDYAPLLLRASSTHQTAELRVSAVGADLGSVDNVTVGAADGLWKIPLTVVDRSATSLTATADVYVPLPSSAVRAGVGPVSSGQVAMPADNMSILEAASAGTDTILYRDPNPSVNVYPKDFAFYYNSVYNPTEPAHPWRGYFHLFYIRNIKGLSSPDSILAHAWTDSLGKAWHVDTLAFRPSGIGWDKKKVWAPSLQQVGNLTYMFYTGVDSLGNQSIGYATTEALGTANISWNRWPNIPNQPVYHARNTGWADTTGAGQGNVIQFRDPFVMPDPDAANYPGRYLLFNAGEDRNSTPHYAIGVARNSPGTMDEWRDLGYYEATDHAHLSVTGALESPLVVRDSLTGAWRMFIANADYDDEGYYSTIFETQTVGDSLTDLRASQWPQRDSLYHYVGNDADVIGWQACEHLQIGQVHFFAAYEGNGIGITRMHWDPDSLKFFFVHPDVTSVPADGPVATVRFTLAGWQPGAGGVRFAVESTGTITPQLTIYDTMGRKVRRLADGRPVQGRAEIAWDCRDGAGRTVPTGLYFARLTAGGQALVLRVPVIR